MAFSRNDSKTDDVCFAEFKNVPKDLTGQALTLHSHANGQETRQNTEEISHAEIISRNCTSHMKHERTGNVEIKVQGTEICINVSGCAVAQLGSDTKALEVKSCKLCSKNCYSSSDEECEASVALKISEVQADSHAHVNMLIYSPMPVIPKRGCVNTSQYFLIITKLKELQDTGDFDGHEKMVEKQMAKLKTDTDSDMEMSLQIERAMALYFQNNIKDAKKILKIVVKQEKQLKNPGILVGRALNLLTAVYKRQKKFGNAMECVERARTCLEGQDSANDKAELHHSYGALITAIPAAKEPETAHATKKEAYKSYKMAGHYTENDEFQEYVHVKMAALLLGSRSSGERIVDKDDVMNAKKHLDFVESKLTDNESLGTRITFLLLRSDQYLYEDNVAMAMEKAQEASALIHQHGFKLEFASAKSRIDRLSTMIWQENEEWRETEFSSSSGTSDHLAESERAHSD
ncbi:uncharacterized protein LOC110049128 [Orbicella faveolata]|uniref:uncharacterized protein LOC110049128 n=1 Tax=Orbicella faveolata TaxID=48498 RepID=UPI0009E2D17F|nr:uncharacterized protein LOC110049128 [Orbicella faveolata]